MILCFLKGKKVENVPSNFVKAALRGLFKRVGKRNKTGFHMAPEMGPTADLDSYITDVMY